MKNNYAFSRSAETGVTQHNKRGTIVASAFKPSRLLRNRHLQTILPNIVYPGARPQLRRERLELPDGDFIDVDWTLGGNGPIVIVLHGLEGSIKSHYAARIMRRIRRLGWRGALLNFRGCSGQPNRLPIGYHSGFTQDLEYFTRLLKQREPATPLAAVGYSLGGSVLLKWLGESPNSHRLLTAVAISVPFDLTEASNTVEHGVSKIYKWSLLGRMRRSTTRKFKQVKAPFLLPKVHKLRSFRDFDNALTAPLHGFRDADDYYANCSSRQYLRNITVPTLVLHSSDDPLMTPASVPSESELSPAVTLELSHKGGHVGFVNGSLLRPNMWLAERISRHLIQTLPRA
ncbi:MAG: hydrolase [Gammaproteobacteria bacterium]|nr:hydrolase [Gammaproteobacteria bacterium]